MMNYLKPALALLVLGVALYVVRSIRKKRLHPLRLL